jgi:hypothetical protein
MREFLEAVQNDFATNGKVSLEDMLLFNFITKEKDNIKETDDLESFLMGDSMIDEGTGRTYNNLGEDTDTLKINNDELEKKYKMFVFSTRDAFIGECCPMMSDIE